jgi:putative Mn2+ efflux pump MntP
MLALLALSGGLAMDAFAVSLIRGSTGGRGLLRALELGVAFGIAQGVMPLIGWALGASFGDTFKAVDHWIAFALLGFLGGKLLVEGFSGEGEAEAPRHGRLLGLLTAAFATSIDAAAAGLTLPMFGAPIPAACLAIGGTTAVLCTLGYVLGAHASERAGKRAEVIGGVVLIAVGIKILIEHTIG